MAVKGSSVALLAVGIVFVWSGLFNKKITQTIQDVVKGTKPVPGPTSGTSVTLPGGGTTGPTPPISGNAQANRVLGHAMAGAYGWGIGAQWSALDWIWTEESRWDNHAENPSGAYGIPQALPGSKMGAAANPPLSSAVAQIRWGLSYIKQRYGDPVTAKTFHLAHGWY